MIGASLNLGGIFARYDKLAKAAKGSVRPAAQAGAQAFYDEVRARAPVGSKEHATKGKKQTFQPGNLRDAIYQAFVQDESGDSQATYRISWNKKKAFYGHFLEYGTSQMAAQPFLRPGYDAARDRALTAVRAVMQEQVKGEIKT